MSKLSRLDEYAACMRAACAVLAAALAGCTLDSLIVLKQPASVAKGETFSAGAVDIILDVTSSKVAADSVFRDSIHVGVGLPAGWEVVSAKACAAPHFRPARASVNNLDTNLRNQLIRDTLEACGSESRAVALSEDPGVRIFLMGRTIRVTASPDSLGPRFNLKTDTVPKWVGFGGRIDVRVPAGEPADTVLDTSAFKAIPVYVYFSIKAPSADTSVRLLYFSKTGKLDTNGFGSGANQDRGGLVYRPLTVGSPVSVRPRPAVGAGLTHVPFSSGHHVISLPAALRDSEGGWARLEIRASSGVAVRAWSGEDLRGAASLPWDGRDQAGRPLSSGRYVLVLSGRGATLARPFPLLR